MSYMSFYIGIIVGKGHFGCYLVYTGINRHLSLMKEIKMSKKKIKSFCFFESF